MRRIAAGPHFSAHTASDLLGPVFVKPGRVIAVAWGSLLLLMGATFLGFGVWAVATKPDVRAGTWWQIVFPFAFWALVVYLGIRRIRGPRPPPSGGDRWDSGTPG